MSQTTTEAKASRLRTDDAAIQVLRENGSVRIWRGHLNEIHEIATRAGHKRTHPINVAAAVISQLARSPKFKRAGSIKREGRRFPVYEIIGETQ